MDKNNKILNEGLCYVCKHNPQLSHDKYGNKLNLNLSKGRCIHSQDTQYVEVCDYFISNCDGCKLYSGYDYINGYDKCKENYMYIGLYCIEKESNL